MTGRHDDDENEAPYFLPLLLLLLGAAPSKTLTQRSESVSKISINIGSAIAVSVFE